MVRPREILIDGKAPGTISLIVWGGDQRTQYDVIVEQPISALEQQIHQLFPGEDVTVTANADAIVLSGRVSSTQVMLRVAEVARAAAPKANVLNMLQVPGATDVQQVMLQVRIAEVNRRALTELGTSLVHRSERGRRLDRPRHDAAVSVGRLQRAEPHGGRNANGDRTCSTTGQMEFSDFLNIFLFNTNWNVGTLIRALKQTGYFQSLAEPNLIAYNGKEASFLAGGEFPVPVVNGLGQVSGRVQGIRCASELHADDRRRPDSPEDSPRSQLARLQQRRHPRRASGFPRCRRGARKPKSSCATASRSPWPA